MHFRRETTKLEPGLSDTSSGSEQMLKLFSLVSILAGDTWPTHRQDIAWMCLQAITKRCVTRSY
jgi:hypothetical protein